MSSLSSPSFICIRPLNNASLSFCWNARRAGNQLIVETHSDHLVNRLRRLIVEDQTGRTSELVNIVFAEHQDGKTTYRQIEPNEFGSTDDWPVGFFDQAVTEAQAILRGAVAKKKSQFQAEAQDEAATE